MEKDIMEQCAPNHVIKYCHKDKSDLNFLRLCEIFEDVNSFVYKLKCTCNCERFIVYQDQHPSVFVQCADCGKMITVYDLKYYPAAVKLDEDYVLNKVNENPVFVYVNYEYNDEFLYEEDVEFNANDITWGKVFIFNDNKLIKVLDDETA